MNTVTISESLYYELEEYFDSRADADGDSEGFYPNKEMNLLSKLQKAFEDTALANKLNEQDYNNGTTAIPY